MAATFRTVDPHQHPLTRKWRSAVNGDCSPPLATEAQAQAWLNRQKQSIETLHQTCLEAGVAVEDSWGVSRLDRALQVKPTEPEASIEAVPEEDDRSLTDAALSLSRQPPKQPRPAVTPKAKPEVVRSKRSSNVRSPLSAILLSVLNAVPGQAVHLSTLVAAVRRMRPDLFSRKGTQVQVKQIYARLRSIKSISYRNDYYWVSK